MTPGLIYPDTPAPVLRGTRDDKAAEMLPVVTEKGIVIRQAARSLVHGGTKPLHPVVHLHIINRFGAIYLQKRSATKKLLPNYWDSAVGGHISYGEQVEEALFREAGEELGFFDFNPQHLKTYVWESATERELVFVFAAVGNFELKPDNDEVSEGRWWSRDEIAQAMGAKTLTPNFEHEYTMLKDALEALL